MPTTRPGKRSRLPLTIAEELRVTIGKIMQVPIRKVWPHEAHDFTTWLATDGLEHLADQLGLELSDAASEQPEGDLFADIVATDSEGRTVVIENQMERTDHGHLGQVVTYLAIEGAEAAVWISPNPRAEHVKSVEWLNEQTETDVWLIRVSVIRIGGSDPAPQFTVVAGPEISKKIKQVKQAGGTEKAHREAQEFWEAWLPIASESVDGISLPKSPPRSVFFSRRLVPGLPLDFHVWVTSSEAYAEIRIKAESEEASLAIFETCLARKEEIENAYGGPLVWEQLSGSKTSKIDTERVEIGSRTSPTEEGMAALLDVANRLIAAFKPLAETVVAEGQAKVVALARSVHDRLLPPLRLRRDDIRSPSRRWAQICGVRCFRTWRRGLSLGAQFNSACRNRRRRSGQRARHLGQAPRMRSSDGTAHAYGEVEDRLFEMYPAEAGVLQVRYGHRWRDGRKSAN